MNQWLWVLFGLIILSGIILDVTPKTIPHEQGSMQLYICPYNNCTKVFLEHMHAHSLCAFFDMSEAFSTQAHLKNTSVIVHTSRERGLMHHKFCVDDQTVIAGSFNPTLFGELYNNNNVLVINSSLLAKNYENEFRNLAEQGIHSTPHPKIMLSGILLQNYFCPRDHCKEHVAELLAHANESIYFMTFSFTDHGLADILIQKSKTLSVQGVMEKRQVSKYSVYDSLVKNSIAVTLDTNPHSMHHKVFVIDKSIVITGSYNPTENGDAYNNENILVIHDSSLANAYLDEFARLT